MLIARVLDLAETVQKTGQPVYTDYYDPREQNLVETVLHRFGGVYGTRTGGVPGGERFIFAIHEKEDDPLNPPVKLLSVTGNFKFRRAAHRDFLGALLSQGLARSKLGDVQVTEDGARVFCKAEVAEFIRTNLNRVSQVPVTVEEIPLSQAAPAGEQGKVIRAAVASLRLDAIASAGYGVSRSKIVSNIKGEQLKLNFAVVTEPSREVKEGDVLSFQGKGRLIVEEVGGTTRSGRIAVILRRIYR